MSKEKKLQRHLGANAGGDVRHFHSDSLGLGVGVELNAKEVNSHGQRI